MIRFGPAGWTYKDWEGVVYPKPKPKGFDPLGAIASLFDTIEINTSFYAPITLHNAHLWLERTAFNPDFRFTAKLWRRFTHQRSEPWTAEDVRWTRVGLGLLSEAGRLGAVQELHRPERPGHGLGGLRARARAQLQGLVPAVLGL